MICKQPSPPSAPNGSTVPQRYEKRTRRYRVGTLSLAALRLSSALDGSAFASGPGRHRQGIEPGRRHNGLRAKKTQPVKHRDRTAPGARRSRP